MEDALEPLEGCEGRCAWLGCVSEAPDEAVEPRFCPGAVSDWPGPSVEALGRFWPGALSDRPGVSADVAGGLS